jgi:DNA-binding MurR/RpiR family transcriptional regulator
METDGPGQVAERVRAALTALPPGERRVARVLLDQGIGIVHASVSEIAEAAGVGVGTVVRTCQSLGFKGYQAAKIALGQDLVRSPTAWQEDVSPGDPPATVLAKLVESGAEAMRAAAAGVEAAALDEAVRLVLAADRVLFLGVGTSAPLAADAAYRFLTIGVAAEAPPDVHVQHVRASLLRVGDVAVAVSHTGATRETVAAAQAAAGAGADVVAVTSFRSSPLVSTSRVALVTGGREISYRVEAMASRIAHMAVLDTLFVTVVLNDPDRAGDAQRSTADVLAEHRF